MSLSVEQVYERLGAIQDPEFGIGIVDLGLVYSVELTPLVIEVALTLTTPSCPAGEVIVDGVRAALEGIAEARRVRVAVVWEPPWAPAMLSAKARAELGWRDGVE